MADLENVINEDLTDEDRLDLLLYVAYCEPSLIERHFADWFELQYEIRDAEDDLFRTVAMRAVTEGTLHLA